MRFCVFGRELSRAVRFCECDVEDLGFVLLFFFFFLVVLGENLTLGSNVRGKLSAIN